ncbi:MAG: deoxyguanosinetriphosphate triphosphohydrolase [Bacteroidia bacterium]|jgi:dGTPase|nr:deoxyguanosinetriphosphate triphosphohydrolase [Bacteroidia bacterium]
MQWSTLFSETRPGDSSPRQTSEDRTNFERDFDRVVFSSAFRRLQDKTQVIPLPDNDFVHTRLTHSLEVSCVGRSLGKMVGREIIARHNLKNLHSSDFGAVVAAAALAHDIGNPPFGHSGEAAISNYFLNGNGKRFQADIGHETLWQDLVNFEGNANGFRLLTAYDQSTGGGSINLTFSSLAAFAKYPTRSHKTNTEHSWRGSQKKYGYFAADQPLFERIFTELGIEKLPGTDYAWHRHPLAFLVEAADDICYRIIDFEDGLRIRLIDTREGTELLKAVAGKFYSEERFNRIGNDNVSEQRGYLRAVCISRLIDEAFTAFMDHESEIISGRFDKALLKVFPTELEQPLKKINELSVNNIYKSRSVLEIEAAGFNVVAELLDLFINATIDKKEFGENLKSKKPYSEKILSILPKSLQKPFAGEPQGHDLYLHILRICEFVAGMTDTYAVNIYRKLKGIELPR